LIVNQVIFLDGINTNSSGASQYIRDQFVPASSCEIKMQIASSCEFQADRCCAAGGALIARLSASFFEVASL
jgi:hypothetical protein